VLEGPFGGTDEFPNEALVPFVSCFPNSKTGCSDAGVGALEPPCFPNSKTGTGGSDEEDLVRFLRLLSSNGCSVAAAAVVLNGKDGALVWLVLAAGSEWAGVLEDPNEKGGFEVVSLAGGFVGDGDSLLLFFVESPGAANPCGPS
jgi:hypothetical protein